VSYFLINATQDGRFALLGLAAVLERIRRSQGSRNANIIKISKKKIISIGCMI
jgi:hypothetical protein